MLAALFWSYTAQLNRNREASVTHVQRRPLTANFDHPNIIFHRMSSSKVEGWLETKIGRAERWERKWVVFDDGVLYFSTQKEAARDDNEVVTQIPMDRVISLRTDVRTEKLIHLPII